MSTAYQLVAVTWVVVSPVNKKHPLAPASDNWRLFWCHLGLTFADTLRPLTSLWGAICASSHRLPSPTPGFLTFMRKALQTDFQWHPFWNL